MASKSPRIQAVAAMCLVPVALLDGWAVMSLWRWFIIPLGASRISLAHAIGISIFANLLTARYRRLEDDAEVAERIAYAFAAPLMALLLGWVVQHWR